MAKPKPPELSTCTFSEDGTYRYLLDHSIDDSVPSYARKTVVWCMLNPSVANQTQLDRTLRRCRGFTQRLGGTHMTIVNAFAFVAQKPEVMLAAVDPVGPLNDEIILRAVEREGVIAVVAGWGPTAAHRGRHAQLMAMLAGKLSCLKVTKDGYPGHPLYLKSDSPLLPFGYTIATPSLTPAVNPPTLEPCSSPSPSS